MDRTLRFFAGVVVGAAVAAAVVVLLTPQSGEDLRDGIKARIDNIVQEGRQAAEDKRLELTAQLEQAKKPSPRQVG